VGSEMCIRDRIYIDGPLQMLRRVNLGGPAGNVTLAVRGDLIIRPTAIATNRHDLSTVAGRQVPGIVVFGTGAPTLRTRDVCDVELNGSGRLVVCGGGTLVADGLIYTQDGMTVGPKAFVDQVGAMYHNNRGTSHSSFINDNATVVVRFDPLALSAFGTGISILSWQQLHGPDLAGPAPASPPAIAQFPSTPTTATPPVAPAPPAAAVPPPAAPVPPTAAPAPPPTAAVPPPAAGAPSGPISAPPVAGPRPPAQESRRPPLEPRSAPAHVVASGGTAQAANPARLAARVGGPEFHVQAGAFRNREYADELVRHLQAHGYSVMLVEVPLIRVWVGQPMNRGAAEELAANLRRNGFEAFLTPAR